MNCIAADASNNYKNKNKSNTSLKEKEGEDESKRAVLDTPAEK